jgi:prolyl oligopeptidase
VREFDLVEKRFVGDGFVLPEAKGGTEWVDDDTLMVATTLGGEGASTTSGYPRTVRLWRRGLPFDAAPVVFEGEATDVRVGGGVDREPGFQRTFFRRQITFEEGISFVQVGDEPPRRIDLPLDAALEVERDWLLVRLKTDWALPQRTYKADMLLAIAFSAFMAGSREFAVLFEPAPRRVLESFWFAKTRLVLTVLDNLASEILIAEPGEGGWRIGPVAGLPAEASLSAWPLDSGQLDRTDDMLVSVSSHLEPTMLGLVTPGHQFEVLKTGPAAFDAAGLRVTRHEAVAEDGERIPYFEIGPAERARPLPTVLYGYGGFAVSLTPGYLAAIGKVWLERGGVWVVANIRGGGEFGAGWHLSGVREGKRRSHDDFAAVARDLARRGVTSREHLAAYGGSNGGLLVGNMLTRYPELFGGIWCTVPLLDMRRYTKLLAGASWTAEYGDPDKPDDWRFLEAVSAYHNVQPGRTYPPALIVTSRRDDRVHPAHARKMAARLEELGQPVWFYEPDDGGHGAANKEQAAFLSALGFAFLRHTIAAPA